MKRIRLKKKRKISIWTYISVLALSLVIFSIIIFIYIGRNVTPKIQKYAEKQAKRVSSIVIGKSVTKEMLDSFETEDLFITNKNTDGTVSSIDFNPLVINRMLSEVGNNVKEYLHKLETGNIEDLELSDTTLFNVSQKKLKSGIIYEVPSGIIFNNGLLANIGPKIPVKINFIGDIVTDVVTDITDYGINNAIIQIGIKVKVNELVILPYDSNQITIETTIPVAIKLIQGTVPNYYFNGANNPSLSFDTD